MQRYKIIHRTYYNFTAPVQLGPHTLRLRPREGHQVHVEAATLTISSTATLRWHRDVEDNSVAIASFGTLANQLSIESEVIIQQYHETPLDFVVAEEAVNFPFDYVLADKIVLAPYLNAAATEASDPDPLSEWIASVWQPGSAMQTYTLLQRFNRHIQATLSYNVREEPGVQSPTETLTSGSGSCRDFANLFMHVGRRLGLASRFVSGYLNAPPSTVNYGATHAWTEFYLPGAGWTGFDPTLGELVGSSHIAVAVSRQPDDVPPVAGTFVGPPGASLDVGVWVTAI